MAVPGATEAARRRGAGPVLLAGGAGVLASRAVALLAGEGRTVLRRWVLGLGVVELVVDLVTMAAAARWWRTRSPAHEGLALRAGAAATLLHAARVLVFVLGRTGPWVDLDVRPEHRADHGERWTWGQVGFAGVLSVLGVGGVAVIWRRRRRAVGVAALPTRPA